jgi:hypothetical protein
MKKSLWKRFGSFFLAILFALGTATALSTTGCEDDDGPVEETADEIEEETD